MGHSFPLKMDHSFAELFLSSLESGTQTAGKLHSSGNTMIKRPVIQRFGPNCVGRLFVVDP